LVAGANRAVAQGKREGVQVEVGVSGGAHIFADDVELGVADDPALTSPKNAPLGALRIGIFPIPMFGIELEGVGIPTSDRQNDQSAFLVGGRGSLVYNIMPGEIADGKLTPFVLAGAGVLWVASTDGGTAYNAIKKDTDFTFQGGVGAKYAFTDVVHLRLDARALGVPNTQKESFSLNWEFMAGVGFTFGGHAPPPPPVTLVKDSDGDGVPDNKDKCPNEPGPRDNDGCPDKDTDGDGVIDRNDKCPDKAGPVEREGCPDEDPDNDGIAGDKDKCPNEAEDKDQFEDEDGCPDPDNDKDTVLDEKDKCPNEPETKNGYQDDDGCPDEVPVAVKKFTGVVKGITFRRNSADIKASSFPLLKEAVVVFKEYPALRVEISGHTSDEGKRDFNMKLSRKRAEAVKGFLTSAGIDESRIGTIGYGPDKPIADNETKEGKEKNRRIEFRLLSTGENVQTQPEPEDINPMPDRAAGGGKAKTKAKAKAKEAPAAPAEKKPKADKKGAAPPPDGDPTPSTKPAGKDKAKDKDKTAAPPKGEL
jgi:outer membrane protein OmpA-like peptidoglycan-associated protein